jgi:hypothetical protein
MGATTRTPAQFRDVVRTAFGSHWTGAGEDLEKVAWDNLDFDPAGLDDYVHLGLAHSTGELASLGAGNTIQTRKVAVFAAQLFVRHNTGQARADALAEVLLDFVESTHLTGIRFRDQTMTDNGRIEQYFQATVTALVEYDAFRSV